MELDSLLKAVPNRPSRLNQAHHGGGDDRHSGGPGPAVIIDQNGDVIALNDDSCALRELMGTTCPGGEAARDAGPAWIPKAVLQQARHLAQFGGMSVAHIDDGRALRHVLLMGNSANNTVGLYLEEQSIGNGEVVSAFGECHRLTDTESKVLLQLARGLAPKRIAQVSGRSEATIRSQIRSILTKTGYGSVRELLMSLACIEQSLARARAWLSRAANERAAMAERRSAPRITPSPPALAAIGAARR